MIIVFFEYDAKPFFFGVTAGKQVTRCSISRDDVENELYELQRAEWGDGAEIPDLQEVQGVARREPAFVDGRWVLLDIIDGVIFVVANLVDELGYFIIDAAAPDQIYVACDEGDAYRTAERLSSDFGDAVAPMPVRPF